MIIGAFYYSWNKKTSLIKKKKKNDSKLFRESVNLSLDFKSFITEIDPSHVSCEVKEAESTNICILCVI